jgi:hypothetical protein
MKRREPDPVMVICFGLKAACLFFLSFFAYVLNWLGLSILLLTAGCLFAIGAISEQFCKHYWRK